MPGIISSLRGVAARLHTFLNMMEWLTGPAVSSESAPLIPDPVPIGRSSLRGRSVIVTGAASGIGKAVALHLAKHGARLALTDLDSEGGKEVCLEIREMEEQVDVVFTKLDVTDHEAVNKICKQFLKTFKRIDGLVNCAGISPTAPSSHQLSPNLVNQTLDVNLKGTFNFCQAFIASIVQPNNPNTAPAGGYSIVNLGGNEAVQTPTNSALQCASKQAISGMSRALAKEYALHDVRVNVVNPGAIFTPGLEEFYKSEFVQETLKDAIAAVPMKRLGTASEVGNVIGFLLGQESSFVTGTTISVDGGLTC